jgi:D,D-heptose 1,7-bisphosphate phosphatase
VARAGILLDRDGTIIVDHGYVGSVDRVEFIDGSADAIARFNAAGVPVVVVTNQAGVARGFYGPDDVHRVHEHIAARLAEHGAHVDLFLYCPYHPDGTVEGFARRSADRKPGPGMAVAAAEALDLDLTSSWVVGDRPEDMGLAAAIGASGVYLGTDSGQDGVTAFPDLKSAAEYILSHISAPGSNGNGKGYGSGHRNGHGPGPGFQGFGGGSTAGQARAKFPARPSDQAGSYCGGYFSELTHATASIDPVQLDRAAALLLAAHQRGSVIFSCGNGGSASIANHLQCDHMKGVSNGTALRPRVVSLSNNVELMTAIANDNGYENVFLHQLQAQARPGDVLFAISSSGRSANIVRTIEWARDHDVRTLAFTGFTGGPARELAEVAVHVDCDNYGIVEDAHQAAMHAIAQYIRQSCMSAEAVARQIF